MSVEGFGGLDRLVKWRDIAKGVGEVVFHAFTDQFLHETPSDHFKQAIEEQERRE